LDTHRAADGVIALPYTFDTTAVWQRIVKFAFAGAGALLLLAVGGLASGKFGAGAGLGVMLIILLWMFSRVRRFPMGATGTLTERQVETHPVRVLWYSLPVPVGVFSIDRFTTVGIVEHVVIPRTGGNVTNTGSVQLLGKMGTPNIEIAVGDIDSALAFASTLGGLLHMPVQRMDAPESRTVRVTIG
jgi:hypothetical protein